MPNGLTYQLSSIFPNKLKKSTICCWPTGDWNRISTGSKILIVNDHKWNLVTISKECWRSYGEILDRFYDDLKEQWPHSDKKKVLLHQANASVYTRMIAMASFKNSDELLSHLWYSPDLAISPFLTYKYDSTGGYLALKMKSSLK